MDLFWLRYAITDNVKLLCTSKTDKFKNKYCLSESATFVVLNGGGGGGSNSNSIRHSSFVLLDKNKWFPVIQ